MMAARKPYVRSMDGWWRRNPYFVRYMIREGSALFLTGYALVLLWGLWALTRGTVAYEAWRAALGHPAMLSFHAVALVLVSYHAYTWWQVAPKTMPTLRFGGKELAQSAVTAAGWAGALLTTVAVLGWVAWVSR